MPPASPADRSFFRQLALGAIILAAGLTILFMFPSEQGNIFNLGQPENGNFLTYVEPWSPDQDLGGGWIFWDLDVLSDGLKVSLRNRETGNKYWLFFIPGATDRVRPLKTGANLNLVVPLLPESDSRGFLEAADKLFDAINTNTSAPELWTRFTYRTDLPAPVFQGAFLLLLALIGWLLVAWALGTDRRGLLATLGPALLVLGVGLLFRWFLSPWAVMHSNQHGLEEMDELLFPLESPYPSYNGQCFVSVMDLIFLLVPRTSRNLWLIGMVVGSLAPLAMARLARALEMPRTAAWAAALAAATLPLLVRVSTSESSFTWVALLMPLAAAGYINFGRLGSLSDLVAGTVALFLLVNLHIITSPLILVPLVGFIFLKRDRLRTPAWIVPAAVWAGLVAACVPHLTMAWTSNVSTNADFLESSGLFERPLSLENLIINPLTTPWILLVLGALGLVLFALKRNRTTAAMALMLLGLLPFFLVARSLTDMIRYQAPAATLLCLAPGLALHQLWQWTSRVKLAAGLGTMALILVAGILSWLTPMKTVLTPDAEARAWLFLEEGLKNLPQSGIMITPDPVERPYQMRSYLPRYIFPEQGKAYTLLKCGQALGMLGDPSSIEEDVFFFQGLDLYWLETMETEPEDTGEVIRTRELCNRVLSGFEVISETTVVKRESPAGDAPMDFIALPRPQVEMRFLKLKKVVPKQH